MKNLVLLLLTCTIACSSLNAQGLKGMLGKAKEVLKEKGLSQEDAGNGLKQALDIGVGEAVDFLSVEDGYYKSAYKILLPKEAQKVTNKLSAIPGFKNAEDKMVEKINRAAEDAAQLAKPIFLSAITKLSFKDVVKIVKGNGTEATDFLKSATTKDLTKAFSPKIADSLNKVSATKYWGEMVSKYNQIPFIKKINPNINSYVTSLAIKGLFSKIAVEEKSIRDHPKARTTELLQKVFSKSRP